MKRNILFLSILIISMISLTLLHAKRQQPVHADEQAVSSGNWDTPLKLSPNNTLARRPVVAAAPNGKTALVIYSIKKGEVGDNDIFDLKYSYSNKNGNPVLTDWTLNQDVYPDSPATSTSDFPHATFDKYGKAHVVWIEDLSLTYANSSDLSSGFGITKTLSTSPLLPGAINPFVVTYNDDVHITWVESITTNPTPNIYHVKSEDNGSSWGEVTNVSETSGQADKPKAAVDDVGNLHVVYQDAAIDPEFFDIYYAMLPAGEITFTTPITITNIPSGNYSMARPSIMYNNGRLEVAVTQANDVDTLPNLKDAEQFVYLFTCTSSCDTDYNNWTGQRISQPSVPPVPSYPALYIDVSPYYLSPSILRVGSCTLVVFDGKISPLQENKEQIFNSSSCNDWGNGRQAMVIDDETRTIKPSVVSQNDWWIYVAYEDFVDENNVEIYFMRNIPGVYLPVILKAK